MSRLEDRTTPAIFTVLNADDAGAGSLRDAVTQANAGAGADVINFDPTFFATPQIISLATALPNVTGEVSFNGPGAANLTISGGGTLRPFVLAIPGKMGTVNFSGMTIANGNTTGNAGAIFCSDENVTITDSVITGNTAAVQGGALNCSPYGRLTILNSTISNNTLNAANGGGAIFMAGRSELIIRNSNLTGNTANGGNGGAIVQYGINTMLIENTTISGNTSTKAATTSGLPSGGGGIFVYGAPQAPSWILRNCTIAGNSAVGNGGGILVSQNATVAASLIIQNCTITGNTADGNAGFSGGGGGISRVQGAATLNITSSVIAENTDTSGAAPDIQSAGTVNVNNSLVGDAAGFTPTGANNLPFGTATGLGPLQDNGGTVQTRVPMAGSALIDAGSNPSAGTNLSALVTSASGTDARGPGFSRNVGGLTDIGAAEAISTAGASATAAAPDVTANGGTLYTFTVTYTTPGALDAGSLGNNDITVNGPAGSGFSQGATFVSAAGNRVTYSIVPPGGAFDAADYGSFSIDVNAGAVTFGGGAGSVPAGPAGRARFLTPATFTVTTTADTGAGSLRQAILDANARIFTSDLIAFQPGLSGTLVVSARMTINDPVTITGPGADLFTLSGNNATALIRTQGPGVLPVTITDLRFTAGNAAVAVNGTTGGGAIFTSNEDVTLDRVIIEGNVSGTFGGGVSSGSNVATAPTPGLLTVRNSTIAGNTATGTGTAGTGGGISMPFGGRLIVENSTISGNTSNLSEGGGIYVVGGSPDGVVVRNSTVFGNTAGTSGGGISLNTITGTALISNSTLVGNVSATSGGNLLVSGTGVVTVTSSVIAFGNSTTGADVGGAVTADHSLIRDQSGATITDGGGNLPGGTDPGFVGGATPTLANNGGPTQTIALQSTSPLRNAGANPAGLPFDQRGPGFARSSGGGVDIGAFEFQVATPPTVLANGVRVNGGQENTTQRSKVTSIDIEFSTQVTFAGPVAAAFQLSRIGGGTVGGFTAVANVVNGRTVVTLSGFTGTETQFGSLADGRYTLTIRANQVTAGGLQLDGDGNGTGGDDFVLNGAQATEPRLYRFFGDVTGDGIVNAADFNPFRVAFGTAVGNPLYLAFLDIDGDGFINAGDFAQFRTRFGGNVP